MGWKGNQYMVVVGEYTEKRCKIMLHARKRQTSLIYRSKYMWWSWHSGTDWMEGTDKKIKVITNTHQTIEMLNLSSRSLDGEFSCLLSSQSSCQHSLQCLYLSSRHTSDWYHQYLTPHYWGDHDVVLLLKGIWRQSSLSYLIESYLTTRSSLHSPSEHHTFLFSTVGLKRALPNCKKEPSMARIVGSGPLLGPEVLPPSKMPGWSEPDARTVGILEMLCLRRRANSSYQFEINDVKSQTLNKQRYVYWNMLVWPWQGQGLAGKQKCSQHSHNKGW